MSEMRGRFAKKHELTEGAQYPPRYYFQFLAIEPQLLSRRDRIVIATANIGFITRHLCARTRNSRHHYSYW